MPLSRLLGRISGILHDGTWSGGHCGHLRVGLFNFASLLPVRGMLDLHRFQVDETREIDFDRNREAVDVEVFYCGLCRSGRNGPPRLYGQRQPTLLLHHAAQYGFGPRAGAQFVLQLRLTGIPAFQRTLQHKTVIETSDVVCIEKDRLFAH